MSKIKPKQFGRIENSKPEKYYPTFNISLKDFPDAKDWKVGEKYVIEMTVRQSSMSQRKGGEGDVSFEILEIEGESEEEEVEEGENEETGPDESESYPRSM